MEDHILVFGTPAPKTVAKGMKIYHKHPELVIGKLTYDETKKKFINKKPFIVGSTTVWGLVFRKQIINLIEFDVYALVLGVDTTVYVTLSNYEPERC